MEAQSTLDHAHWDREDLLSAHPPFLTPAIQLIRDLLRNTDCNVSLVGAEAQQGKSPSQRACRRSIQIMSACTLSVQHLPSAVVKGVETGHLTSPVSLKRSVDLALFRTTKAINVLAIAWRRPNVD